MPTPLVPVPISLFCMYGIGLAALSGGLMRSNITMFGIGCFLLALSVKYTFDYSRARANDKRKNHHEKQSH